MPAITITPWIIFFDWSMKLKISSNFHIEQLFESTFPIQKFQHRLVRAVDCIERGDDKALASVIDEDVIRARDTRGTVRSDPHLKTGLPWCPPFSLVFPRVEFLKNCVTKPAVIISGFRVTQMNNKCFYEQCSVLRVAFRMQMKRKIKNSVRVRFMKSAWALECIVRKTVTNQYRSLYYFFYYQSSIDHHHLKWMNGLEWCVKFNSPHWRAHGGGEINITRNANIIEANIIYFNIYFLVHSVIHHSGIRILTIAVLREKHEICETIASAHPHLLNLQDAVSYFPFNTRSGGSIQSR